jgi:3-deoxy-D-manno-octulosonate cytidylyltransferase
VASALLAQGIVRVGRSFKLHRPRGIFSCGVEEPIGLVDIGQGGARTPNTRATDIAASEGLQAFTGNAWPSLGFDLAAVTSRFAALLPAGFYYKTFMWPHWQLFEPMIRRMAGLGVAADGPDPDRYDQVSRQVQVLVVGAGAAGVQAALAAAQGGQQVLLVDGAAQLEPATAARAPELKLAGVELLTACTVFGLYDHGLAAAVQTVAGAVRERLWQIRAHRIILATGAFERPMLFPDNDRPGVMLASAVLRYATHYGVACGHRVVVATDSERIVKAVTAFGGEAVMTSPDLQSGTDRVGAVADLSPGGDQDIFINVQGDEPLIDPANIEGALETVTSGRFTLGTCAAPLPDAASLENPNVVKVLIAADHSAIYFSRFPIPYSREKAPAATSAYIPLQHQGIYVYTRRTLKHFCNLKRTPLEAAESLEQLRALHNGIPIGVARVTSPSIGVDTPEDLELVRSLS